MADLIAGLPLSISLFDLRLKADKLALQGYHEEAQLLHALLDGYAPAVAARRPPQEAEEKLDDLREEKRDLEKDLETAQARVEQAKEIAEEAAEQIQNALRFLTRANGPHCVPEAMAALAEALGLLLNSPEE